MKKGVGKKSGWKKTIPNRGKAPGGKKNHTVQEVSGNALVTSLPTLKSAESLQITGGQLQPLPHTFCM